MFSLLRTQVLRVLRVPHDPDPPAGAPGSVQVFRAGKNFYLVRLVRWGFGQVAALLGIVVSLTLLGQLERGVEEARRAATPVSELVAPSVPQPDRLLPGRRSRSGTTLQRVGRSVPPWVFPLIKLFEWGGILVYFCQIPVTYAMARLDFELRWYMVTDRSLRIRSGLASVQEMTMSFANVQQVVVSQGPLQRLLGIADVQVQSAGGGGGHTDPKHGGAVESLHTGVFHGVDNAAEIRDLILERLRQFRVAGLGDPDDQPAAPPPADAVAAARELIAEARALRRAAS